MPALVYHGPEQTSWDTAPDPVIEDPTDVSVRVSATTTVGELAAHDVQGNTARKPADAPPRGAVAEERDDQRMEWGYEVFSRGTETGAPKVVLHREGSSVAERGRDCWSRSVADAMLDPRSAPGLRTPCPHRA